MTMPGNRAKDAYARWCNLMGDFADDGTMLPRWEKLSGRVQAAWVLLIDGLWREAGSASSGVAGPPVTAGTYGPAASAVPAAGAYGPAASAVPSMSSGQPASAA
jgi:hypothetical protein